MKGMSNVLVDRGRSGLSLPVQTSHRRGLESCRLSLMSKHSWGQSQSENTGSPFFVHWNQYIEPVAHPKREWKSPENRGEADDVTSVSCDRPRWQSTQKQVASSVMWKGEHYLWSGCIGSGLDTLGKHFRVKGSTIYWGFLSSGMTITLFFVVKLAYFNLGRISLYVSRPQSNAEFKLLKVLRVLHHPP